MAKFLLRRYHSIYEYGNEKTSQSWGIQKVCHLHNVFHSIHLCHTLSTLYSITSAVLLKISTMEWEKWMFLVYMAASAYHVTSKEVEN